MRIEFHAWIELISGVRERKRNRTSQGGRAAFIDMLTSHTVGRQAELQQHARNVRAERQMTLRSPVLSEAAAGSQLTPNCPGIPREGVLAADLEPDLCGERDRIEILIP